MNCCGPNLQLCIPQYATYTRVFTWIADPCNCGTAGAEPQPIDLTGYTAQMQIRPFPLSNTVLYDASADITLGGTAGTIILVIPGKDTAGFTWWNGVYDLLLTSPQGIVTRILSGDVEVCPGVSAPSYGEYALLPGGEAALLPGGEGILTP